MIKEDEDQWCSEQTRAVGVFEKLLSLSDLKLTNEVLGKTATQQTK